MNIKDNRGFSLVEMLVAVTILAVIFIPVLKSFTTGSIINAKAQDMQNATTIAEKVLEDVKGNSIQELSVSPCPFAGGTKAFCALNGDPQNPSTWNEVTAPTLTDISGNVLIKGLDYKGYLKAVAGGNVSPSNVWGYRIKYDNVVPTQRKKYKAVVDITSHQYSDALATDASDANVYEIPQIAKIDSSQHAVLSWEINQYDVKFVEKLAEENAKETDEMEDTINNFPASSRKDTTITISSDALTGKTKIACDVRYSTGDGRIDLTYTVYTGYFNEITEKKIDGSDLVYGPNVYVFFTTAEKNPEMIASGKYFTNENIIVNDETTGKRHNVYLAFQDGRQYLNSDGTHHTNISFNVSGSDIAAVSKGPSDAIDPYYTLKDGATVKESVRLYTSLVNGGSNKSNLFGMDSKDRVYYINVTVMKQENDEVVATMTSTMPAGKEVDIH